MLKRRFRTIVVISILLAISGCRRQALDQAPPTPSGSVRNSVGMQLKVAEENTQPTLRIVLPSHPASDRAIEVIFRSTSQYDRAEARMQISSTSGNRRNTASDRYGGRLSELWSMKRRTI